MYVPKHIKNIYYMHNLTKILLCMLCGAGYAMHIQCTYMYVHSSCLRIQECQRLEVSEFVSYGWVVFVII